MFSNAIVRIILFLTTVLLGSVDMSIAKDNTKPTHGLVGLRPLSRDEQDWKSNHGGSWEGTPTYVDQKGNYPFVAEHLDVVKGWLDGDFKTKQVFFEHYWGLDPKLDDLDPEKNDLVKKIKNWEDKGGKVIHILIAREYRLAINRGHKNAKPGPFKEDTRILFEKDIDDISLRRRTSRECLSTTTTN